MGILLIGSPAVHVQFHGGERFPLEIADVHQRVLSAENAVHVRTDIGLPGKAGADVGGNMETDIPNVICDILENFINISLMRRFGTHAFRN